MTYELEQDPYINPTTGVMHNIPGITDAATLARNEENGATLAAVSILESMTSDKWDSELFRHLHRELFKHVYDWAGDYRIVEISKDTSRFAAAEHISSQVDAVFRELEKESRSWQKASPNVIDRLAHYYSDLNAIHPFREGNGRTIRLLLSLIAKQYGWHLDWSAVDKEENVRASAAAFYGDEAPLRAILRRISTTQ